MNLNYPKILCTFFYGGSKGKSSEACHGTSTFLAQKSTPPIPLFLSVVISV